MIPRPLLQEGNGGFFFGGSLPAETFDKQGLPDIQRFQQALKAESL
jgi:hypothetical protein